MYPSAVNVSHVDRVLESLVAEGQGVRGKTQSVLLGHDILEDAARWIVERHPDARHLCVCDSNTLRAGADRFASALRGAGRSAELWVLEPAGHGDAVVCDDATVDRVRARLASEPGLNPVAVGAGSLNDIVKMAATLVGRPYQCVATAASMNGYTSAIAAVLSRGVKVTTPTEQAQAVFADIDIITAAPPVLTRAGFGDLLSKPFSHADWLLSHHVRGAPYAERPARLLDDAYELLLERAEGIGLGDPEAIAILARALLVSGFCMAIAGTSAPASGGEHLVSHYWDMEQHCLAQPVRALHGTQVGIATRLSAFLFDRLGALTASDIDPVAASLRRPDPSWLDELPARHPGFDAEVLAEVRARILAKQRHGAELRAELEAVRSRWPDIRAALGAALVPATVISRALVAAGAPARPSDIGVAHEHAVRTLQVCRHVRDRYVALDLMDDLGVLGRWSSEAVDACEESDL